MKKTKAQLEKELIKVQKELAKTLEKIKVHNNREGKGSSICPMEIEAKRESTKKTSMIEANEIMARNMNELTHCLTHAHNIISKMDGEPNKDIAKDGMEFENSLHGIFDFNIYHQYELIKLSELIVRKLSSITE